MQPSARPAPTVPAAPRAGEAVPVNVTTTGSPLDVAAMLEPGATFATMQSAGAIWDEQATPVTVNQDGRATDSTKGSNKPGKTTVSVRVSGVVVPAKT